MGLSWRARAKRVLLHLVAYAVSVGTLIAYASANAAVAPDENKALGAAVAATVIFTDLLVFGMHHAEMLTAGPHYTVALLGSTRALLVSFDKSAMFLGFCFSFVFFGATFGMEITDRRLKAESLQIAQINPNVGTCGPCLNRIQAGLHVVKALLSRICAAEAEALLMALCIGAVYHTFGTRLRPSSGLRIDLLGACSVRDPDDDDCDYPAGRRGAGRHYHL